MAMNWYQCKYCGITVKKETTPNQSGCTKKSSHYWSKLGEVGDINYQCKRCGTVVQTKSNPSQNGCPSASSHYWSKL